MLAHGPDQPLPCARIQRHACAWATAALDHGMARTVFDGLSCPHLVVVLRGSPTDSGPAARGACCCRRATGGAARRRAATFPAAALAAPARCKMPRASQASSIASWVRTLTVATQDAESLAGQQAPAPRQQPSPGWPGRACRGPDKAALLTPPTLRTRLSKAVTLLVTELSRRRSRWRSEHRRDRLTTPP